MKIDKKRPINNCCVNEGFLQCSNLGSRLTTICYDLPTSHSDILSSQIGIHAEETNICLCLKCKPDRLIMFIEKMAYIMWLNGTRNDIVLF